MKFGQRTRTFLLVLITAFASTAVADLTQSIDSIVNAPSQNNVIFAVHILDPGTGAILYSRNASTPLTPASNMKLITTAAALKYLGPNFVYETRIGLIGDAIAVIGSGDPLLGDKATMQRNDLDPRWMLKDISEQLRKNNFNVITDIIVDSSVFDDERVHPSWPREDLNRWYACEVSGLNYNGNCVEVIAKAVGRKVELTLEPPTAYVEIINKCKPSSGPPDTVWCARQPGSNIIAVSGLCHKECQPIRVSIDRPAAFFGFLLAEELKFRGIGVQGQLVGREVLAEEPFKLLCSYRTRLWDVLERCNKDSLGLAAEALLKTIAAHESPGGKGGSWPEGQKLVSKYLLSLGIPPDQFIIDDASGLSDKNRLSANAITAVLLDIRKTRNWQPYKDTLSVGGVDGTADKYFNEPQYRGKIFGKTGYISGVKSFSGVCTTASGDRIFAILTNKANGGSRQAINDIVKAIINESQ